MSKVDRVVYTRAQKIIQHENKVIQKQLEVPLIRSHKKMAQQAIHKMKSHPITEGIGYILLQTQEFETQLKRAKDGYITTVTVNGVRSAYHQAVVDLRRRLKNASEDLKAVLEKGLSRVEGQWKSFEDNAKKLGYQEEAPKPKKNARKLNYHV